MSNISLLFFLALKIRLSVRHTLCAKKLIMFAMTISSTIPLPLPENFLTGRLLVSKFPLLHIDSNPISWEQYSSIISDGCICFLSALNEFVKKNSEKHTLFSNKATLISSTPFCLVVFVVRKPGSSFSFL